jgi:hypothetical protein
VWAEMERYIDAKRRTTTTQAQWDEYIKEAYAFATTPAVLERVRDRCWATMGKCIEKAGGNRFVE